MGAMVAPTKDFLDDSKDFKPPTEADRAP